jgi:hypothetical protein
MKLLNVGSRLLRDQMNFCECAQYGSAQSDYDFAFTHPTRPLFNQPQSFVPTLELDVFFPPRSSPINRDPYALFQARPNFKAAFTLDAFFSPQARTLDEDPYPLSRLKPDLVGRPYSRRTSSSSTSNASPSTPST